MSLAYNRPSLKIDYFRNQIKVVYVMMIDCHQKKPQCFLVSRKPDFVLALIRVFGTFTKIDFNNERKYLMWQVQMVG
jgi:hypothetical protein